MTTSDLSAAHSLTPAMPSLLLQAAIDISNKSSSCWLRWTVQLFSARLCELSYGKTWSMEV